MVEAVAAAGAEGPEAVVVAEAEGLAAEGPEAEDPGAEGLEVEDPGAVVEVEAEGPEVADLGAVAQEAVEKVAEGTGAVEKVEAAGQYRGPGSVPRQRPLRLTSGRRHP